jgi:hypothetical protein
LESQHDTERKLMNGELELLQTKLEAETSSHLSSDARIKTVQKELHECHAVLLGQQSVGARERELLVLKAREQAIHIAKLEQQVQMQHAKLRTLEGAVKPPDSLPCQQSAVPGARDVCRDSSVGVDSTAQAPLMPEELAPIGLQLVDVLCLSSPLGLSAASSALREKLARIE